MFKIAVIIAATFVNPTIPDKIVERQIVKEGATYADLGTCREALQHSAHVQGLMASTINKALKFIDEFEQPAGYSLRGVRVRATCIPALLDPSAVE